MAKIVNKGIVKAASMMKMDNRMNYFKTAPGALEAILEMDKYVRKTSIDKQMKEMIKIRVSQINGCSYCLNMHTKTARKLKITEEKLNMLAHWEKEDIFSAEEKAAFELTENLTLVSEHGVSDQLFEKVREYYSEKEYVELVMVINLINTWNRLSISMGNHAET